MQVFKGAVRRRLGVHVGMRMVECFCVYKYNPTVAYLCFIVAIKQSRSTPATQVAARLCSRASLARPPESGISAVKWRRGGK